MRVRTRINCGNSLASNSVTIAAAFLVFATISTVSAEVPDETKIVSILQSFPGASGPGYKPVPDTTGAVGPNHVVDFAVSSFTVHDKSTGKVLAQMLMPEFWKSVEPKGAF